MTEVDHGCGDALVLVRAASPFLPNAVLARREARCVALAERTGRRVTVIPRTTAADGAGAIEALYRRATASERVSLVTWSPFGLIGSAGEFAVVAGLLADGATLYEAQSGGLVAVTMQRLAEAVPSRSTSAATEARDHAARTREGRRAVAREGGWLGGRFPLGWSVGAGGEVTLDPVAAAHIRAATLQTANGTKAGAIAAQWNATGFTTLTGRPWTFGSARRVLVRARNAGLVEYRGEVVGRSAWPAIVSVAEWRGARAQLLPRSEQRIA